ncbi:GH92 family glycosyl hydrolase [Portibacter lacus]|uniref:Glycosyl hydrolase family 92 domain-containing protein n=1 Tax=Portibacter lacus TaxID=1099794 RepID=A0AA37STS8_9BACT|nr:GH92 family glycosyl hydrolase [Portibacter lacus]GLR17900.1 hypothetical protein GCM10007940_25150 [Portibacter lacus]
MKPYILCLLAVLSCLACTSQNVDKAVESETDPVEQVYPLLDAANSRWFFFASACRPFGMVTLNPDTQNEGAWGSGYKYNTDTIKGFSHIHGWQISGVSVLPVSYASYDEGILDDYFSSFSHDKEDAQVGYHKVELDRYNIKAELTSSTRVGFHRYTFGNQNEKGIVFKLSGALGPSDIKDGSLTLIDEYTLHGQMTNEPTRRRPKDFVVYFNVKFDQPIKSIEKGSSDNQIVTFEKDVDQLQMKVAISYTSNENAALNLETEIPDWDFDQIVADSKSEWNQMLGRIKITDEDETQKRRFYTDLWHGLQGRRIISDVNGAYPDYTGEEPRIGKLPLDENGKPKFNHYNSDSFWGAQWTINTLWGLLYPDIYNEFVNSLLVYYKDGGIIPRGPSGGNYTYVMTGSSATPFLVSAYQKGIRDYDVETLYEGLKKNHLSKGIMSKAGYEHKTSLGGGLDHYIENGYVPYPIPEGNFGYHQDGASLTLEYAYQDWTLAQLAKALGKTEDYNIFSERAQNYANVYDAESGWMRPKSIDGVWKEPFDPYQYENGFNESNGAQSTWFVGHDIPGLAKLMGGNEVAVKKLNAQFEEAAKLDFTPGNSHERGEDPTRARIPINYGNQPSIQTAFIFNQLGRPDLTQLWTSKITKQTFGGLSPETGYSGDEDQGLMGSLAVIIKLGIFQMNGGTEANPIYEFGSPLFSNVEMALQNGKTLTFEKKGNGIYIDHVSFNGKKLDNLHISHDELNQGGVLIFNMKETP